MSNTPTVFNCRPSKIQMPLIRRIFTELHPYESSEIQIYCPCCCSLISIYANVNVNNMLSTLHPRVFQPPSGVRLDTVPPKPKVCDIIDREFDNDISALIEKIKNIFKEHELLNKFEQYYSNPDNAF